MGEVVEIKVLRPMCGHSREEWNPTVDDIAPSEAEASYWAIFGITPRGNWHCLGQFPTKDAAQDALFGKHIRPVDGRLIVADP